MAQKYQHARPLGHAQIGPGEKPSRPHDAATLIIWRNAASGVEVLMGCRSRRVSFVPGFFVFPGGRLDRCDYDVGAATPFNPSWVADMGVRGNERMAKALAVAAVRETFEETGLLLAASGDVGTAANAGWADWRAHGLAPDLHRLGYFGRATTSAASPIRFNARFFIVHADHLRGTISGSGELSQLAFYSVSDVMRDRRIVDVTEFMLKNLMQFVADPDGFDSRAPVFSYKGIVPFVRYSSPRPANGAAGVDKR